ncbi:MAG: glycoside hydrolase family 52 protein [Fimbriimonadaceae bacterium]
MNSRLFNAHHSPIGAFASLTLGYKDNSGGLGLELAGPANENVYVGVEDLHEPGCFRALPFFRPTVGDTANFDAEHLSGFTAKMAVFAFAESEIERQMGAAVDEWRAGDLTFRLLSPVRGIPDPETSSPEDLRNAVTPAIYAELTVDNRQGTRSRRAFFGYQGSGRHEGMRVIEEGELLGVGQGTSTGIATLDKDVYAGIAFQSERILSPDSVENLHFLVGDLGLLVGTVKAGELRTFRFGVGFFREGTATSGLRTRYFYRRYFDSLESVLNHALGRFESVESDCTAFDEQLGLKLSPDRYFMLCHAVRSYLGSTQLLEGQDGRPIWVVNEGEYRMMNTFDLTVDQAFFELAMNPWTVRNVLDLYAERYSYVDGLRRPHHAETFPGGISFTHDMGVANVFSRPTFSGYEQSHVKGCFSYMSAEQLMNWILTGALYEGHTKDFGWAISQRELFHACLASLMSRDDPDPARRNGLIGLDAERCKGASEITTYDSLDPSLGQARNNLYLGVKAWASYMALENLLRRFDDEVLADEARAQAARAVETIVGAANEDGLLPAVIGEGVEARIIPAIEALVYAHVLGLPIDPRLKQALTKHLKAILKPGVCLFADGGWKLSSTSRNSWLSKIYLCQFVAERILGQPADSAADAAHRAWLLNPENSYYAWSDQMLAGKAVGSRYYPRGVTAILWLTSDDCPLNDVTRSLAVAGSDRPLT